jgi:hypothetical protein
MRIGYEVSNFNGRTADFGQRWYRMRAPLQKFSLSSSGTYFVFCGEEVVTDSGVEISTVDVMAMSINRQ